MSAGCSCPGGDSCGGFGACDFSGRRYRTIVADPPWWPDDGGFERTRTTYGTRKGAPLREQVDDGAICPCCTQFAKVYRRKVHAAMALALIDFYRRNGRQWAEWPGRQSDEAKLRYWELFEHVEAEHGISGEWRITDLGERWMRNQCGIPKYARIYDGRRLSLDASDGYATIVDALGTKFDYHELMLGL